MLDLPVGLDILKAAVRLSVPILLAAVGASYMVKVNLLNLGLEGMMLTSAFFAAAATFWASNPVFGLVSGIVVGLLVALVFGFLVIDLRADPIIVGIAINLAAAGFTTVALELMFGVRGLLSSPRIVSFSAIRIPGIDGLPVLGELISGYDPIVYLAAVIAAIATVILYRTPLGLRVRAVGERPEAAASAGINLNLYRHLASLFCGALCGIAGAYLPLGGLSMFTENMTAGKGFIALAAALFANGVPSSAVLASLIFGCTAALGMKLQRYSIPSHFVLMLPYILTLLVLFLGALREMRRRVRVE